MSTPSTLIAGRYRLVKLLGAGGMGVVWQAWDERLERRVALKMLRTQPELTDRERDVATNRAMREARITAGLHHPHAVMVHDVVEHEGQPCIVMQLVESTPLSILLREHGTLTPSQTAQIGAQVGSALAAAHKLRIVHRDVKPGNILITGDGSAMISDFGISHALGDATITATGLIHGTPAYLAPEVARGRPSSFASDVFSLGSSMYAMLEGEPPFGADKNAIALLHRVARGGYPPAKRAGALAPLLREMLSPDPKRRPAMTAIAAALADVQGFGPPVPIPVPTATLTESGTLLDATTVALEAFDEPSTPAETPAVAPAAPAVAAPAVVVPAVAAPAVVVSAAAAPAVATPPVAADAETESAAATEPHDFPVAVPERPGLPAAGTGPPVDGAGIEAPTAETSLFDKVFGYRAPTAETARLEESFRDDAPTLQGPTGQTRAVDQPTRYEPPTAETERLVARMSASAASAPVIPRRPPIPPGSGAQSAPPRRRRRVGAVVAGVVALVVGALVVGAVLLLNPFRMDAGGSAAPAASQSAEPSQTAEPSRTPTPPASTTAPAPVVSSPPPPPVIVEPPPPTAEERVVQTISGYYALVPGNLDGAWPAMTADYQQNHAGGRNSYNAFWSAIAAVEVTDVSATAPDGAQATLTYYYNNGRVVQEVTAYRLVDEGGILKIAASDVLSSVNL